MPNERRVICGNLTARLAVLTDRHSLPCLWEARAKTSFGTSGEAEHLPTFLACWYESMLTPRDVTCRVIGAFIQRRMQFFYFPVLVVSRDGRFRHWPGYLQRTIMLASNSSPIIIYPSPLTRRNARAETVPFNLLKPSGFFPYHQV